MLIWIEITNAAGTKYGPGPITTATSWTSTRPLDSVGTFSFTMPASDPMAAHLANKRYVKCWAAGDDPDNPRDAVRELGAGIIEEIALDVQPGTTSLVVSGYDLLSELANITVGNLSLFVDEVQLPEEVKHVYPVEGVYTDTTWEPEDSIDLMPVPELSYIYVRSQEIYWRVRFVLGSRKNTVEADLEAQYFNELANSWDGVALTDGTAVAGVTFAQTGNVDFDPGMNWGLGEDEGYTLRLYKQKVDLDVVDFDEIYVTVRKPTLTALADVIALAPDGWTLDAAGYAVTEGHLPSGSRTGVYLQMAGESVLTTLTMIAAQTGEHFRLGTGRTITWIGKDQTASGLRALSLGAGSAERDDNTFYLSSLQRTVESYNLFTRIYAWGGGVGDERLSLQRSTTAAPAGYTVNRAASWLQNDTAITTYGRIDAPGDFPNITPTDNSKSSNIYAANALFQRAYEELQRASQVQQAYGLSVVPARYSIEPGETIRVVYDEWVDGYHSVAVDDTLWVLDVTTTATVERGEETVGMTVATVDMLPTIDGVRIAQAIITSQAMRSQTTPENGLTDDFIGDVSGIRVRAGKVINVTFRPEFGDVIPDGWQYPPPPGTFAGIRTVDGKIVEISYTSPA